MFFVFKCLQVFFLFSLFFKFDIQECSKRQSTLFLTGSKFTVENATPKNTFFFFSQQISVFA